MSSLQYLEVVFCFLSLIELTRFSGKFCVVKFYVLGKDFMDYGTRSGKSLSLGMPMAMLLLILSPKIIQGQPKA